MGWAQSPSPPPLFYPSPPQAHTRSQKAAKMKEADLLPTLSAPAAAATKPDTPSPSVFGKARYKFWALGAIILLAFWSMLTGTVTLKWSAGDLTGLPDDLGSSAHNDLDILEVEEREEVVRHMWDVYVSQSRRIRLARFWQEAFEAAYEELASDDAEIREAAVSEIAKMSMRMVDLDPPTRYPKNVGWKNQRNVIDRDNIASVSFSSVQVQ